MGQLGAEHGERKKYSAEQVAPRRVRENVARQQQEEQRASAPHGKRIDDQARIAARGGEIVRRVDQFRDGDDVLVVVGGIIPDVDIPKLRDAGVKGIFLPGSPMQDIITFITENVRPRVEQV